MPFRLQYGALPRAAPRAAYPRPFSRFFALAVWGGGLLTTVFRPQPCGLVSLRMGITQYSEVSAEYASCEFLCSLVECSSVTVFLRSASWSLSVSTERAALLTICTRRKLYVRNPCLFMGFARVYMFHRSNALRIVRKYVLEFFQPLAAPQPTKKPKTTSNGYDGAKLWTPRCIEREDAEAAEMHQTRRWRSSRDAGGHGDSRGQRTSSNGGDGAELRLNAAGQRK